MLRITTLKGNISATAKSYYSKEDNYYNQEATTFWHGNLSNELGLIGEVNPQDFEKMLSGILPNGNEALSNKKNINSQKRMGYDFTFSAPKSISIQGLVGNDINIIKAHDEAVKIALDELQKYVGTRKRLGNERIKESTNNFAVATFRHELSRSHDPQIHTHAVTMNMTKREDGKICAISNENLFKITKQIDAIYKNELLNQIHKLGYEVQYGKNSDFELAHISRKHIEVFSKRSQQINDEAQKRLGKEYKKLSAKEQRIIAQDSRSKKTKVEHGKLRQEWQKTLQENNLNLNIKLNPITTKQQEKQINSDSKQALFKIVEWSINHHIERQSAIKKSDLIVTSINHSQGKVSYLEIKNYIDELIKTSKIAITNTTYAIDGDTINPAKTRQEFIKEMLDKNISFEKANSYFEEGIKVGRIIEKDILLTTKKAIQIERKILDIEKHGRNKFKAISKNHNLDKTSLNPSQKNAVEAILSTSNQFIAIQGDAGVGKSFALKTAIQKIQDNKFNVQVLAPYSKQVQALKADGLENTKTLASFLSSKQKDINQNSIIVLDEAGIVSNKQMLALMSIVQKNNSRLILLGDTKQTQAIEAGKPFYELQKHGIQTAHITEIQRQKDQSLKDIVQDIAQNNIISSYDKLKQQDNIQEIKKDEYRYRAIAKDYTDSFLNNQDVLLIVGENKTRQHINTMIRKNLGLDNTGIHIDIYKNIDMSVAEKQSINTYQIDNYLKLDNNLYQIKAIDYQKQELALINQDNQQVINIKLDSLDKTYLQSFEKNTIEISIGEHIKFTQQDKYNNIANNDEFIIKDIKDNSILLENKHNKQTLNIDKDKLKYIDYAYSKTIHASQGLTADKTILELDYRSPTVSKNVYYVAISRAKHKVKVYTNDIKKTKHVVQREQEKSSSLKINRFIDIN